MIENLRLDGNAAAGVLAELFAVEVTAAVGTCDHCGALDQVGAVHAYRGAGLVLRCRSCESVLMRIVEGNGRTWIDLRGLRSLEISR